MDARDDTSLPPLFLELSGLILLLVSSIASLGVVRLVDTPPSGGR
jgi:hypothetical protein